METQSVMAKLMSLRMQTATTHARNYSDKHSHDFGNLDDETNTKDSPRLSRSGLYFHTCRKCGRSVFENSTGSASEVICTG